MADLGEEERHCCSNMAKRPFLRCFSSTEKREGLCILAACADRPCSKPAQSLKVAPAGRASPRLLLKTISGKFRIHAMAGSERRSFALVAQHRVYADGSRRCSVGLLRGSTSGASSAELVGKHHPIGGEFEAILNLCKRAPRSEAGRPERHDLGARRHRLDKPRSADQAGGGPRLVLTSERASDLRGSLSFFAYPCAGRSGNSSQIGNYLRGQFFRYTPQLQFTLK